MRSGIGILPMIGRSQFRHASKSMGPIKKKMGANLPHWTAEGATYFVTFRLGDSLPQGVLERYRAERERLLAAFKEESPYMTIGDVSRLHELFEKRIEKYLDAGAGECWMAHAGAAEEVQNSLLFFHGERYFLNAWAVMPNHVHAVVHPAEGVGLSEIMHSWKSFTANAVNKLVNRSGAFWQAESWDHLVRDESDFARCVEYTVGNPGSAGLREWRWVGRNLLVR